MPKISVVIPAYNAGRFLPECLNSLLAQSLTDYEVIVCDDGSSDNTAQVVADYVERDARFSYSLLNHLGAGAARNYGLERAQGEYLYFLDADDMIAPDALESLYSAAIAYEADIVVARSHYLDDVTKAESSIDFTMIDVPCDVPLRGDSFPKRPFQSFVGWPWDKLFDAEFIRKHGLVYQNLRSSNDAFFVYMALCKADCITCIDKDLFTHRTNNSGSLERTRSKSWNNAIAAMRAIHEQFLVDTSIGHCWVSFVNWISHFSFWSMSSLGDDVLTPEIVSAFDEFLAGVDCGEVEIIEPEDAAYLGLCHKDRIGVISEYIALRRRNEALVSRLYSEEHELMREIDRLQHAIDEKSGSIMAIEGSRSYKLSVRISRCFRGIRGLLSK